MDAFNQRALRDFLHGDAVQRLPDTDLQRLYEVVREETLARQKQASNDLLAEVLGESMTRIHLDRFHGDEEPRRLWYRTNNGLHNAHLVAGITPDGRGGADLYPACGRGPMHVRHKNQAIAALSVISRDILFSRVEGACDVCRAKSQTSE